MIVMKLIVMRHTTVMRHTVTVITHETHRNRHRVVTVQHLRRKSRTLL
jgi:hypothetical protein